MVHVHATMQWLELMEYAKCVQKDNFLTPNYQLVDIAQQTAPNVKIKRLVLFVHRISNLLIINADITYST